MKKAYSILLVLFAGLAVNAQQVGQNNQGGQATPTFQVSSQLVIETVTVTGKGGMRLSRDSRRKISALLKTEFPKSSAFLSIRGSRTLLFRCRPPLTHAVIPLPKYPQAQIGPETAGKVRYHDRRLLVLYFDMSAMPLQDQLRAFEAAEKFVRTQMTKSDLMAVMMYDGGSIRVLQDFTDDRERVLTILKH